MSVYIGVYRWYWILDGYMGVYDGLHKGIRGLQALRTALKVAAIMARDQV